MLNIKISSKEISGILKYKLLYDKSYKHICKLDEIVDDSIYFINKKIDIDLINELNKLQNSIFIVKENLELAISEDKIITHNNPRYAIAKILTYIENNKLYVSSISQPHVSETAIISNLSFVHENVIIEDNVIIEPFCFIGENVIIKKNSIIKTGVKIVRNVEIGESCIIHQNSVVGGNGFGIEKDEDGNNFRIPHLAGVKIEDHVEIGALNTLCSGTFSPTFIDSYVKTDDHIHLAHNIYVGKNTVITAGVIFSGSVKCEDGVWIGVNSSIRQGAHLGRESFIGMGSVVTNDVMENEIIAGNPAKEIVKFKRINNYLNGV